MSNAIEAIPAEPTAYRIRLKGQLDQPWADWFEGLAITLEDNGDTLLSGPVADQAALHGLLKKIRDLGMPLLSITPVECNRAEAVRKDTNKMGPLQRIARSAGLLYLAYIVTFATGDIFLRRGLIVLGSAAGTADKILANAWLFRAGFVSELVSAMLFFLAAWALYVLLKPVKRGLALLFLLLNLAGVVIECMTTLNWFAALLLVSGAEPLKAIPPGQLNALAMAFIYLYKDGFMIAQIFFGAWLVPLGYLVYKSGFLPKALGVLLMLDCAGVLIWFCQFFFLPGYEAITYPGLAISFLAEVSLSLWLAIKGVDENKLARAAA